MATLAMGKSDKSSQGDGSLHGKTAQGVSKPILGDNGIVKLRPGSPESSRESSPSNRRDLPGDLETTSRRSPMTETPPRAIPIPGARPPHLEGLRSWEERLVMEDEDGNLRVRTGRAGGRNTNRALENMLVEASPKASRRWMA